MDYGLPRAGDLPDFEIGFNEVPTLGQSAGRERIGSGRRIAAPQTVMNAVLDALGPLGIAHLDMPATPQRIWEAIRQARERGMAETKKP